MNIFFLHLCPKKCAAYYFNKHCVKIILEITQLLYTAQHCNNQTDEWIKKRMEQYPDLKIYKKTHAFHPMAVWVRKDRANYYYALSIGIELCKEYTKRYSKVHACQKHLVWLYYNEPTCWGLDDYKNKPFLATQNIPENCTPVPLAMPEQYYSADLIYAYRCYYIFEKERMKDDGVDIDVLKKYWEIV